MNVIRFFFLGLLGSLGALTAELVASNLYFIFSGREISLGYYEKVTVFLILVILIEESFKYILLRRSYAEKTDNFFLTIFLSGSGFSLIESYFAFLNNNSEFSETFILSAAGAILLHIITYGIIASLISAANPSILRLPLAVLIPSTAHFIYNFMVIKSFSHGMIYAYLTILSVTLAAARLWRLPGSRKNQDF